MRDVGCKLSGNLFQPPRRNKRLPAAASIRKSSGAKLRDGSADREQEVVELNSKLPVRVNDLTQEDLEIKARRCFSEN